MMGFVIAAVVVLALLFLERIAQSHERTEQHLAGLAGPTEPSGARSPVFMIVALCLFAGAALWCILR
jgi:hypothetical protein